MSQSPVDFVNILVQPPGDLLFFLAVILLTQAGLFMALERRLRAPDDFAARRYVRAGIGVTLVWAVLMIGGLFALLAGVEARVVLPPVERTAQVVTILLLGWAFLTDSYKGETRHANIGLLVVLIAVIVGYIHTGTQWPAAAEAGGFNASIYGAAWALIAAAVSLFGLILAAVYFRGINDAPVKMVFFAALLLGYVGTLFQIMQGAATGDYAGLSRLAFLAALPVMPAVVYRLVVRHLAIEAALLAGGDAWHRVQSANAPDNVPQTTNPIERESVQLLKALGVILDKPIPAEIPLQVVRAALEVVRAEVGLLLTLQDANYADITCGYDMIMQRPLLGMALNLDEQPTLVNAVERRTQRPLFPDRNESELRDLYTRLDIDQHGPAYFQPLVHNDELVAVMVVALPYSGRELSEAERERLRGIAIIASGMLALSYRANESQLQAEAIAIETMLRGIRSGEDEDAEAQLSVQDALAEARKQIAALSQQVTQLKIELDAERSRVASGLGDTEEGLSISQRMMALNEEQQRLLVERNQLLVRLQEAETALAGATAGSDADVYNAIIETLRREKEDLLAQRNSLEAQLNSLKRSGAASVSTAVQQVLASMADEKARLEGERSQLQSRLADLEAQLAALGIENGPAGLAQLIGQLHEQRAALQARYDALKRERDALLNERASLQANIEREQEREKQIHDLQKIVKNLAADREAAVKQRDALRAERDELLAKQDSIKEQRARLIAEAEAYRQELEEAHKIEAQLRRELQSLTDSLSDLSAELDHLKVEKHALEGEREQLLARLEGDRSRVEQVTAGSVGSLTSIIEELTAQRAHLERELHEARAALAALESQVKALQAQTLLPARSAQQPRDPALILGMVQELRTPLTSIVGYVDLLLAESAGILGEMQRRFLQRVAANVARLLSMMEDLARITALDMGQLNLVPEPVDLVSIIEDAITASSSRFREKGLTIHLNLDDDLPLVAADRDALSQIIGQLLTNAYLASPPDSEIFISAGRQSVPLSNNGSCQAVDSLIVSIEDRGGGIAPEDVERVFARKYRAENPLIQGLGDTGVGMAIAKALVEAHGGMLWLETRAQIGSAFYLALPLEMPEQAEQAEG